MHTTVSVPYDNGNIAEHFEKAAEFKVYVVEEDGTISSSEIVPFTAKSIGGKAMELGAKITNLLICNKMKMSSRMATAEANMRLLVDCTGNADDVVQYHIEKNLIHNTGMWGKATHSPGVSEIARYKKHQKEVKAEKKRLKELKQGTTPKLFGKKD